MKHTKRRAIITLGIASLLIAACSRETFGSSTSPIYVEPLGDSGLKRMVLTERAAERLDIQISQVREEQVVRKQRLGAEVVTLPTEIALNPESALGMGETTGDLQGDLWVKVVLNERQLAELDRGQPVFILPLELDDEEDDDDEEYGWEAYEFEGEDDDDEEEALILVAGTELELYYFVANLETRMSPGQRVFVEFSRTGSGMTRKVIPYAAVIYDVKGDTWVYVSPEPFTYFREVIQIDYIDGDKVVLLDGPSSGVSVVTVGVAELFGAETGVSK